MSSRLPASAVDLHEVPGSLLADLRVLDPRHPVPRYSHMLLHQHAGVANVRSVRECAERDGRHARDRERSKRDVHCGCQDGHERLDGFDRYGQQAPPSNTRSMPAVLRFVRCHITHR